MGVELVIQGTDDVLDRINQLANFTTGEMLDEIGQYIVSETAYRFRTSTDYQGNPLAPLSAVTRARRGQSAKPLVDRGNYRNSYTHQIAGDEVRIGTNDIRAGVLHYGAKKGAFGRYSQVARYQKYSDKDFRKYAGTKKGFPIPWNDIPARQVLGINAGDEAEILSIAQRHVLASLGVDNG